ncbi:DedA family protein [Yoonia sediminilitoris]|uniref:Membrane protein DedA with SNARE-associated domain n=1 Tax=Yoonia sediminilitoris TaxID=1286148 RepID=A0A2T6KES6_9RHOB|nr:DedA family protein [Yoonia sediminilitoris]PUB13597.1 membrane protein DedA with SNARE-associated domain [Yoonia sediminilitoris]RCW94767.1 membrane protein DedA with SNARE-associated domain [Yoonia sediminilitoris]
MTDMFIGMIPAYGLFILFGVVSLACLAVPLPSSMLVLASGAFAATGDLILWQVMAVAFAAFVLGDQIAFRIAAGLGPRLLCWMRSKPKLVPVLNRSERLLKSKGQLAVLISHTVLSPTCPYVSYLCGAGGMRWSAFSPTATVGAAVWVSVYVALGYAFATQLGQVADILNKSFGLILAVGLVIGCIIWLRKRWHIHLRQAANKSARQ